MAHNPTVVGTPTETAISTAGTSHVVNLPSGAAGNLFIAIMDKGSTAATVNSLTGWNELLDENSANGLYIAWKAVDGTEGATTTFTLSASTRGAWIVYEINGAYDPTIQPPEVGTTASGSSTSPDPPSVSVTGGSKDILTIACFGRGGEEADDDTWVTAAPSGFGGLLQKACGTVGTNLGGMVATAHLAETTATANPAAFTCATGAWRAQTIVVHPVPPTQTAVAEVSLASADTPATRTSHSIKVRARTTAGAGTIRAALYEGATNRSGDLESGALTTSLADYTLAIPDASAANITDYSNLGIRFWGYAASGGSIVFEVDQLYLEIPASSGIVKTGFGKAGADGHGADVMVDAEAGRGVVGLVGTGVSASVTAETGFATGGLVGSGQSASLTQETGFGVAGLVGSGARARLLTKTGAGVAGLISSGSSASVNQESGFATAGLVGSGASASLTQETGYGAVGTVASGASEFVSGAGAEHAKAGFASAGLVGSGASESVTQESGAGVAGLVGSGVVSKAGTITKAGFGAAGLVGGGASASVDVESGVGTVGASGYGASASVNVQAGFGKVGGVGSGFTSTASVKVKSGFATSGAVGSGSRLLEHPKAGYATAGLIGSGSKANVHERSGQAFVALAGYGYRNSEFSESGYGTVGVLGAGAKSIQVFFTELGPIHSGRIGDASSGSLGRGESGSVSDTVAGVLEEVLQEA